jgi:hypothetical protein
MEEHRETNSMNLRRNIRASLHLQVTLQGLDRWARPFEIQGKSVDFSWKGLGLVLDRDILAPGSVVSVSVPKRFHSNAVVQWSRPGHSTGQICVGLRLIDPKTSLAFRIAASILLCIALVGQMSLARSRSYTRTAPARSCTMGLAEMKGMLEKTLSRYAVVSDTDKAFSHVLHQHMTCEQYTQAYEKSAFYSDPRTRAAVANWHWTIYHAQDEAVRAAAIQSAEAGLSPAQ